MCTSKELQKLSQRYVIQPLVRHYSKCVPISYRATARSDTALKETKLPKVSNPVNPIMFCWRFSPNDCIFQLLITHFNIIGSSINSILFQWVWTELCHWDDVNNDPDVFISLRVYRWCVIIINLVSSTFWIFSNSITVNSKHEFSENIKKLELLTYIHSFSRANSCIVIIIYHLFFLTVPTNFAQVLREHTQQGLRVLAVAWRPLEAEITYDRAQNIER